MSCPCGFYGADVFSCVKSRSSGHSQPIICAHHEVPNDPPFKYSNLSESRNVGCNAAYASREITFTFLN